MHRSRLALACAVFFLVSASGLAQADWSSQVNPPCTPPPNTASTIVCFGDTPCPAGYSDPVGRHERALAGIAGQNPMLPPQQQRWLCQEASPDEATSSSAGATATPTTPDAGSPPPASNASSAPVATPAAEAATAAASTTILVFNSPTAGQVLTDPNGMALYTRSADPPGRSTCSDACTAIWPPLQPAGGPLSLPSGATGTLGLITRDDGTQQVTYNGAPLYTYTGDLKPGDVDGTIAGAYQPATP